MPPATGMSMNNGYLTGTPSTADYRASQSTGATTWWSAIVFACSSTLTNGVCNLADQSLGLQVYWEMNALPYYTTTNPIQNQNLKGKTQFSYRFAPHFVDVSNPGNAIAGVSEFTIEGLPFGSGLVCFFSLSLFTTFSEMSE